MSDLADQGIADKSNHTTGITSGEDSEVDMAASAGAAHDSGQRSTRLQRKTARLI
uniref:Uncharacterized protein n=1 Tax=Anguilla anguilla TaxID=7936 RepID=A0A0E9UKL4_ANGAN